MRLDVVVVGTATAAEDIPDWTVRVLAENMLFCAIQVAYLFLGRSRSPSVAEWLCCLFLPTTVRVLSSALACESSEGLWLLNRACSP